MEKISKQQLFVMVMMEQIGSTNLWALGIEAKRDAWLVILVSMVIGAAFLWVFTELQKQFPLDNTSGLLTSLLGKLIGGPLALLYGLEGIFNTTRTASEFTALINVTFLQRTPPMVIMFLFLGTISYVLLLKVETLARVTEIILPVTLLFFFFTYVLVAASGRMDLGQLTPVLEDGIAPVLKASYPVVVNFPFGLAFVFMQFWRFTEPQESVRKTTFLAVLLSGLILSFNLVVIVSTLGTNLAAQSTVPSLETVKMITIGEFVTNLDVFGIIFIFIGGFYMTIILLLSTSMILSTLFNIHDYRWPIIPLAACTFWYATVYEPNYPFHVHFLPMHAWQQFVPFFNAIPVLLLIIFWLKRFCMGTVMKK